MILKPDRGKNSEHLASEITSKLGGWRDRGGGVVGCVNENPNIDQLEITAEIGEVQQEEKQLSEKERYAKERSKRSEGLQQEKGEALTP